MGNKIHGGVIMEHSERYNKGLAIFSKRVQDLLQDGYHIVVHFKDNSLCLVKLRHHNGNKITIKYNYPEGIVTQRTNNVLNFHEQVC